MVTLKHHCIFGKIDGLSSYFPIWWLISNGVNALMETEGNIMWKLKDNYFTGNSLLLLGHLFLSRKTDFVRLFFLVLLSGMSFSILITSLRTICFNKTLQQKSPPHLS